MDYQALQESGKQKPVYNKNTNLVFLYVLDMSETFRQKW